MAEKKKRFTRRITLKTPGTASFAHLRKPDSEGTYADNKYKVTVLWDDPSVIEAVVERLTEVAHGVAKGEWGDEVDLAEVVMPFRLPEDQTRDDYEGKLSITPKSQYAPLLIDAKRNKLAPKVQPFSGDEIAVQVDLTPYVQTAKERVKGKMVDVKIHGVTTQLVAVQLIKKNASGGEGDASAFDDHDDGYEGPGGDFDDDQMDGNGSHSSDDDDY